MKQEFIKKNRTLRRIQLPVILEARAGSPAEGETFHFMVKGGEIVNTVSLKEIARDANKEERPNVIKVHFDSYSDELMSQVVAVVRSICPLKNNDIIKPEIKEPVKSKPVKSVKTESKIKEEKELSNESDTH